MSQATPQRTVPRRKINAAVLLIVAAVFVTIPLLIFLGLFLWLNQSAFDRIEDIPVKELAEIRLELKNLPRGADNRPDPLDEETLPPDQNTIYQNDPDIWPTLLDKSDFEPFLAVLANADPVTADQWPAKAYLGKLQIRYQDGRSGTVLLYWATEVPGDSTSPARVYMMIGGQRYRACRLKELRTVAEAVASRGKRI
jgi:hypothetical protein